MSWSICFLSAILVIAAELIFLLVFRKKFNSLKRIKILYCLFLGVFLIGMFLHYPSFWNEYEGETHRFLKSAVYSVINAIRVFATEDMYGNITEQIGAVISKGTLSDFQKLSFKAYELLVIAVQFFAPFLTFGFVASFIKNFTPGLVYKFFTRRRDVHVFSELNEKTLALAISIQKDEEEKAKTRERQKKEENKKKKKDKEEKNFKPLIVFTGCDKNDEDDELIDEAREIGALIFRSPIDNIRFRKTKKDDAATYSETDAEKAKAKEAKAASDAKEEKKKKKRKITFYLTGEDESEKIGYATNIIENYDYEEVSMYVFSDGIECELLLSAWDNKYMKIYRVNDIQALVYHNLYMYGDRLFKKARETNGDTISAVIIGLGKYGIETLKALAWYCQVPGFKVKITAFDADPDIEAKFRAQCPELMEKNRDTTPGEAYYDINIYGGVDVGRYDFFEKLKKVYDPTYVFVSLGNDEDNISLSTRIRSEYKRIAPDKNPDIETVVFNSDIAREMSVSWDVAVGNNSSNKGITTFKNEPYDIHMIGDLESFYSVKTVIDSELIAKGMEVNTRWAKTEEAKKNFWKYSYNYKSSIAKAIHESLRQKLVNDGYIPPIKGVGKKWEDLEDDEKLEIGMFEHVRWNAYMRGEGYRYGIKRVDIAKMHKNLVPVYSLSDDDLRNDA